MTQRTFAERFTKRDVRRTLSAFLYQLSKAHQSDEPENLTPLVAPLILIRLDSEHYAATRY
jgi:hypothetical protein